MNRLLFTLSSFILTTLVAWHFIWPASGTTHALQAGRTYTTNADFAEGTLIGVESSTVPNQLQLSREGGIPPYIWVPNQNEGSISKVDTRTGREAGRYRVGGGTSANPSRTTVDLQGNCWVGNRNYATVVKVALAETDCVDRNSNNAIETSRDANNDGDITGAEVLDWGKDECVLRETVVASGKEGVYTPGAFTNYSAYGDEGTRAMAIDANGNVWAGVYRDQKYFNLNAADGAILRTVDVSSQQHTPYGAAIDRYGNLWSASLSGNHVLRINLATGGLTKINLNHQTYGLGLDKLNHLFVSGWESSKLSRINVVSNQIEWTKDLEYRSRGIVVTDDNDVWIANSNSNRLLRWSNDGVQKTVIATGSGEASGVSLDQNDKLWVVNRNDSVIRRIDPATNAVDLPKTLTGTSGHYGYSDMTGRVARTITSRTGTWTVVYDSGAANTAWGTLRWQGSEPAGTSIKARVRSSANQTSWSNWEQVTNGTAFNAIPANRYLQIEVTLQITTGETSPVLYDVTITPGGGGGGACTYNVTPTTQAFSAAAGTGTINVATSSECGWTATRSAAWINVTAGGSGAGNGTVTYSVAANTSPSSRVSGLLVAGRYVVITQAGTQGNCPVTPLTIPQTVNATLSTSDCRSVVDQNAYADLYSFNGQAGQRIAITHTTTAFDAYLILMADNGVIIGSNDDSDSTTTSSRIPPGSGFYVLPYTGAYLIEASSFNANETGNYTLSLTAASGGPACSYNVSPALTSFNAAEGDGNVTLTAPAGCEWTAGSLSSWIRINSGLSGSGNGTINFTVSANTSQGFRIGRFFAGGQFVVIVQGGTGGNCPIMPVGVPSTTNGAWAVGDCASGSGGFSDLYSFSGQAGQQVSIETVNQSSVTGLYLYGPTGAFVVGYEGNGTQRIPPGTGFYVLPYTGTYLIEANAGTQGNYTLNLNVPSVTPTCPTLSGFTPSSGAVGASVTITGNNFTGVTAVRFANNVSASFTVNSATQITATVPSGAVTGPIMISKAGCADASTNGAFTVTTSTAVELIDHAITGGPIPAQCVAPAAKSNFAPTDERAYQWSSFINLRQGDVVRWEFVQPNGTVYDTQSRASDFNGGACFWAWIAIAGQPPASLPGDWQVRVSVNGTLMVTERFRILPGTNACPTVTTLSAAAGAVGSSVTLTGANFTGITAVRFANNVNAQFTVNSDTSLTAVVPAGAVTGAITLSKPNCADTATPVFTVTGGGGPCTVKADYQLQNTLNSSIGTPPALANLGGNTFGTATVDGNARTVLRFAAGDGVAIAPTTGVIANQVYTAVVLFSFNDIGGYRRILDFKNNAEDTGLYNRDGFLAFFSGIVGTNAVIPANTFVQVVLTRDAAKNVVGYVNGVQQFSFVDNGDAAVIDGNNRLIFFRDNPNNEVSAGSLARIRLYDCALTPSEVAGLDRVSGNCPTVSGLNPASGAVGASVTITGANFTGVTAVRFANNVNASFTVNSATQITATVPSGAVTGPITISKAGCSDVATQPFTVTTAGPCIDVAISSSLTAGTGATLTVPITVSDTTGKNAIAYDATINYDPAVLRLQNPPTDRANTLSSAFTVTTNTPAAGQLRISGFGSSALAGAGTLLNLKFDVIGAAQACSNLSFASFRFNEGTPCSTTANGRACVTGGGTISGAVSYCITPKPVPNVAVNVTGSSTTSTTTNTSGNYTLPNLASGNYTLTPAKTGDANGIASFDAALIAQHVVGINQLNQCQQLAGDTSNNGELSSFDAGLIAQYVVGIANPQSIAGTWKFVPPNRTYTNLSSNQTEQNFNAVLVGDVSGNWAAGAALLDELARISSPEQQANISLPALNAAAGASLTIPITIGDLTGKGVIAYDFDLVFDQNVLQAQATPYDAAGTLSSALTITANPQPGRLRLSAFGTQPLAGAGTLLNLKFTVTGGGGTSTALTWQRFLLNETAQTALTHGRVSVANAVACVSAASYAGAAMAAESIVAAFGTSMATRTEAATTIPLPTMLAGTTVRVLDSAGAERLAPLFFVSSIQINYQLPPGTANGATTIIITSGDGTISTGTMQVARVTPGLFTYNATGQGVPAAQALRVMADGSFVYEDIARYDAAQQRFVPLPINLGPESEQVYLILYGTGVRFFSNLASAQAKIGGVDVPVPYVGAVEGLIGLDQLNVGPLPRTLAGRGEVNIAVQVDGQATNVVTVAVR